MKSALLSGFFILGTISATSCKTLSPSAKELYTKPIASIPFGLTEQPLLPLPVKELCDSAGLLFGISSAGVSMSKDQGKQWRTVFGIISKAISCSPSAVYVTSSDEL